MVFQDPKGEHKIVTLHPVLYCTCSEARFSFLFNKQTISHLCLTSLRDSVSYDQEFHLQLPQMTEHLPMLQTQEISWFESQNTYTGAVWPALARRDEAVVKTH